MNETLTQRRDGRTEKRMDKMTPFDLRVALDRLGLSQADLARIIGMDAKGVRRACEEGGEGPSAPVAFAVRSLLRNQIAAPQLGEGAARSNIRARLYAIIEDAQRAGWSPSNATLMVVDEAGELDFRLLKKAND